MAYGLFSDVTTHRCDDVNIFLCIFWQSYALGMGCWTNGLVMLPSLGHASLLPCVAVLSASFLSPPTTTYQASWAGLMKLDLTVLVPDCQ